MRKRVGGSQGGPGLNNTRHNYLAGRQSGYKGPATRANDHMPSTLDTKLFCKNGS